MLREALIQAGMASGLAAFIDILIGVIIAASFGMAWVLFGIWIERKMAGRIQLRLGPNRVGPYGLIQNIADALKLLTKEIIVPRNADKPVYWLAPVLAVVSVILIAAVIPFSSVVIGTDLNIGILYVIAVSSIGTIAILMAGWGSNNKYALLSAFRVVAQLISYEVPMVLALLIPVMLAGTMSMQGLVEQQHVWYIFQVPLAALLFLIASQAENGRAPFDLLEAESELVSGYNIEYSGMAFAMFYLAEFMHAFFIAIIFTVLFLGGWRGPGAEQLPILGILYLMLKATVVYSVTVWLRLTVPRVRIDQILDLNWKVLVPLALVMVVVLAFLFKLVPAPDYVAAQALADGDFTGVASGLYRVLGPEFVVELPRAGVLLLGNILLFAGAASVLRWFGRRERLAVEDLVDETDYSSPAASMGAHGGESPAHPSDADAAAAAR
ncbi:MAG: NADH-quinone oxidoreductase subunit NuoH [Anaerolineae bacterium]|nr:NADH-quinone oxidoreductase subunit NuoH [Anaerolineae bacterium]